MLTAAFRCPSTSTDVTDTSPKVCKPYLVARAHVTPYLEPYYHQYAESYVDTVRPYVEKLNNEVYSPALDFGKRSYKTYGAPSIHHARGYGQVQWEKSVKPQIDAAQAEAKKMYDASLAPHVSTVFTAAAPYYNASRDNVLWTYHHQLVPAYTVSRPFMEKTYALTRKVTVETGLPYVQQAIRSTMVFVDRIIWPKVRVLYGENVEPQLVRIGERLGRYRDGKKLNAAIEDINR